MAPQVYKRSWFAKQSSTGNIQKWTPVISYRYVFPKHSIELGVYKMAGGIKNDYSCIFPFHGIHDALHIDKQWQTRRTKD